MISVFIMFMTISFFITNHPLSMGLVLLTQTTLIAIYTSMLSKTSWFSYILFMIMIGGMLVLFIYMTSIASNKKFKFSSMISIMLFLSILMIILMKILMDEWMNYFISLNEDLSQCLIMPISMIKFIEFPMSMLTFMLIIYLLIALIAVVKITSFSYGPLRTVN